MPYYIKRKKRATKRNGPDYKAQLDKEFSLYIRLRDSMDFEGKSFKCISCGKIKPFAQADCGHYFSRRHMSTRFDEDNCHAECRYCNRFNAEHLDGYRKNLIKKIGQKRFDLLYWRKNSVRTITACEYKILIKHYKKLNKEMKESLNM